MKPRLSQAPKGICWQHHRLCVSEKQQERPEWKGRNTEIRRRVNMPPVEQRANKHTSGGGHTLGGWHQQLPRVKLSCSSQKDNDQGECHRITGKTITPKWYKEMGIPMTEATNWVNDRRPIVCPLDADCRRVRLK